MRPRSILSSAVLLLLAGFGMAFGQPLPPGPQVLPLPATPQPTMPVTRGVHPPAKPGPDSPGIQVSGTFQVEVSLQVNPSLPSGTTVSITATVQAVDSTYNNSASLTGTATVSDGQAGLTLNIPYTWQVASTSDQVSVEVSISSSAPGSGNVDTYSDSTSVSDTVALPANNATTPVMISTSI
jgi:hypothetical protein